MIDLNKMTLEEVEEYCKELDRRYERMFILIDGIENAIQILKDKENFG